MDIVTCDRDWRDYILVEATLPSLHYPHCTLRHGPCCAQGSLHRARRDTQTPAPLALAVRARGAHRTLQQSYVPPPWHCSLHPANLLFCILWAKFN